MANANSFKVIYFDFTGRAELIRLTLTAAGKKFVDERLSKEEWATVKPSTPFGQIPVIEIDGKMYAQSLAISNYLAKEFGLYGETNLDAFKIDQTEQLTEDLIKAYVPFYYETDEEKKAEIERKVKEEEVPKFLGYYEKMLQENGTGYLVGDSLTLGDLVIFDVCTGFMASVVEGSLDKFPLVKALVETVGNNDRIKPYMEARKK